jgi:hypothetical protein
MLFLIRFKQQGSIRLTASGFDPAMIPRRNGSQMA